LIVAAVEQTFETVARGQIQVWFVSWVGEEKVAPEQHSLRGADLFVAGSVVDGEKIPVVVVAAAVERPSAVVANYLSYFEQTPTAS